MVFERITTQHSGSCYDVRAYRWYTNVEKHLPGLYEPVTATVCDSMVTAVVPDDYWLVPDDHRDASYRVQCTVYRATGGCNLLQLKNDVL